MYCAGDSQLISGSPGDNCGGGNETLAVDTGSAFIAGIYENSDGTFSILTVSWAPGYEQTRFCTEPPDTFGDQALAQAWLDTNEAFVCGCPSVCEPGA